MSRVKRVQRFPFRLGGEPHSGWLPSDAATPLTTPIRDVLLDIEIQAEVEGYLLCYKSEDGTIVGDTWHQSIADAERVAQQDFGVQSSQWLEG